MTTTNFIDKQTVIEAPWLNDVNGHTYSSTPISPATTVHPASVIAATASTNNSATTAQAQLTNVGSATGASNVGYTPSGTGAVATTVQGKLRERVSVLDFGADPTGGTSSTIAIQNAIDSGASTIVYPNGTYLTGQLNLKSNQKHIGKGGILVASNTTANIMQGISISNVDFIRMIFSSTGVAVSCIAVQGTLSPASNCANILVDGCSCTGGIQLFSTYQPNGTIYSTITDEMLADNVRIIGNSIKGITNTKTAGGLGGIALYYAKNSSVIGNKIQTQQHGISFWGGAASPSGDVALNNTRKCYNLTITGNTVVDVGGGGIWGSMGNNINITGNTVTNCSDVGIDFEGCFNSVASGNVIQDAINGALVTYTYQKGILFSGNTCVSSVSGRNLVMHNSRGGTQTESYDVSYIGNLFHNLVTNGVCYVTGDLVTSLTCNANTFINTCVKHISDGARTAVYLNNTFTFQAANGVAFKAIDSENAHNGTVIKNNTFKVLAAQPANTTAVYSVSYSYGTNETHDISNNHFNYINGVCFPIDVQTLDGGGTSPIRWTVNNNTFGGTIPFNCSALGQIILRNNHTWAGEPIPLFSMPATPPSGSWSAGQVAYAVPVSGSFIGGVCTVAGTPGTWKTFGLIS